MRKMDFWKFLFSVATFVISLSTVQAKQLDQAQPGPRDYGYWFERDVVRWQEFRPALSILEQIDILLCRQGSPGDVVVELRDSINKVLWSTTIPQSSIPPTMGQGTWIAMTIPEVNLTIDESYYIYVRSTQPSPEPANRYFWGGVIDSAYTRGTSSIEVLPDYDFCFRTWGSPKVGVTIRGTVYDAVTLALLSDVTVEANGQRTQTDDNGEYEISNLTPGTITITASKVGYGGFTDTCMCIEPGSVCLFNISLIPDIETSYEPARYGFTFTNTSISFLGVLGYCSGMTYTSLYNFLHNIEPRAEENNYWVAKVQDAHITLAPQNVTAWLSMKDFSLEDTFNMIARCLLADTPCPLTMAPDFGLAHSVLAYKMTSVTTSEVTLYFIYVYDGNYTKDFSDNHLTFECRNQHQWSIHKYVQHTNVIADFLVVPEISDDIRTETYNYLNKVFPHVKYKLRSPASLEVTDPNGFVINKDSPDANGIYYRLLDVNDDGYNEDMVIILNPIEGRYSVEVIPDPNAEPNETYTLEEYKFGEKTALAEDVEIQDIPDEPYKSVFVFPTIPCEKAMALLDYELISQERITRTEFEYTFRVRAANSWKYDVKDITVQLIGEPNNTIVLDDTIAFSFIAAGNEALSDDTFKIRTDRTIDGLPSEVVWEVCDCKMNRRSDFNLDWNVNFYDFAKIADAWLISGDDMPEDIYPDGNIDLMDIMIFSEEWLR